MGFDERSLMTPTMPRRIVCLTAETAEMLYALGAADRVVGVSCYAPQAPDKVARPVVSVFTTFRYEVIDSLEPDLILAFSDLQADAARELGQRGHNVVLTNARTINEVMDTLMLLGRIVDRADTAAEFVSELQAQLDAARREAEQWTHRPTVYFEEWNDPLITGIAWVRELIEAAGGRDAFAELSDRPTASQRIISPETVIERQPEIIIASWCGKRARLDHIRARPGWDALPAVRDGAVHEIAAAHCLRPGPTLITEGLPRFQRVIHQWRTTAGRQEPTPGVAERSA